MQSYPKSWLGILVFALLISLMGCKAIPEASPMMATLEDVDLTSRELRLRLNDYTVRFTDHIERAADEIIATTDDDQVKRNALIWKIYAVPTAQQALFLSDPLAALADGWTFSVQMKHYFESEYGQEDFGEWHEIGLKAATAIEHDAQKIARLISATGDSAPEPNLIYKVAQDYPIQSPMCHRISIQEYTANLQDNKSSSLVSVAGEVATGVDDLREHVDYYVAHLPRRIRWEGEYLMEKAFERPEMEQVLRDLAMASEALVSVAPVVLEAPELADSLFGRALSEIDRQRLLIMLSVAIERDLILEVLSEERALIMSDINRQRLETLEEINLIRDSAVRDIQAIADDIIDRVFLRMAQVFGGLLLLTFLGIILLRLTQKPRAGASSSDKA